MKIRSLKPLITSIILASCVLAASASSAATLLDVHQLDQAALKSGLNPMALNASLNAYSWALKHHKLGKNKNILTVVNFNLPSYKKRMWVVNLQTNKVLMKLYTTQGKGSGAVYATHFSNRNNTDDSSLGLYATSNEYHGEHGLSMRLDGLEEGVNDLARRRNIVIHSANYATPNFIKRYGYAGRSWGCFAVDPAVKNQFLKNIKGGSAFFAYTNAEKHDPIVAHGPYTLA